MFRQSIILLLVFGNLTRGTHVPTLTVSTGLSGSQVIVLDKITTNHATTADTWKVILNSVFNVFSSLDANTDEDVTNVQDALVKLRTAFDSSFDAILIGVQKSCSAVENARTASYGYLNDAATQIAASFKLAQIGNYDENKEAIESYKTMSEASLKNVGQSFYDSIRTCINIDDAEMLTVIETSEAASSKSQAQVVSALFNGIKVRATSAGYNESAFTTAIEESADAAVVGSRDDLEYQYTLLKTYVLYSSLNQSGIATALSANQRCVTVSYSRYAEGHRIVLETMEKYLTKIHLGLDIDEYDVFEDDNNSLRSAAAWNDAESSILASILAVYPNTTTANTAAGQIIYLINNRGGPVKYALIKSIVASGENLTENLENIEALRTLITTNIPYIVKLYYTLIRNDRTFTDEIEAELTALQAITNAAALSMNEFTLDGSTMLANAALNGEVTEEDLSKIDNFIDNMEAAAAECSQSLAAAILLVLLNDDAE